MSANTFHSGENGIGSAALPSTLSFSVPGAFTEGRMEAKPEQGSSSPLVSGTLLNNHSVAPNLAKVPVTNMMCDFRTSESAPWKRWLLFASPVFIFSLMSANSSGCSPPHPNLWL